jgi:hypothetical protein
MAGLLSPSEEIHLSNKWLNLITGLTLHGMTICDVCEICLFVSVEFFIVRVVRTAGVHLHVYALRDKLLVSKFMCGCSGRIKRIYWTIIRCSNLRTKTKIRSPRHFFQRLWSRHFCGGENPFSKARGFSCLQAAGHNKVLHHDAHMTEHSLAQAGRNPEGL